jgi:hypothetical protein
MRHLASARGRYFDAATAAGYERLDWQISSDDPRILAWPWEALVDPQAATLAHACRIERRLNQLRDPDPLSQDLLRDRINILLITARPYEDDVQYRSISRPLVELILKNTLPASARTRAISVLSRSGRRCGCRRAGPSPRTPVTA